MRTYKIKLLAPFTARFREVEMVCDDDDHAIERPASLRHAHGIEVWEGDRFVWEFQPRFTG